MEQLHEDFGLPDHLRAAQIGRAEPRVPHPRQVRKCSPEWGVLYAHVLGETLPTLAPRVAMSGVSRLVAQAVEDPRPFSRRHSV